MSKDLFETYSLSSSGARLDTSLRQCDALGRSVARAGVSVSSKTISVLGPESARGWSHCSGFLTFDFVTVWARG